MKYSEEIIKHLKNIELFSLVELYGKFKKNGNRYMSCCPFHAEKTPSFEVNTKRNTYHCYGCGVHGNGVINFIMAYEKLSFTDTVAWLLNHYKISHDSDRDFLKSDLYKTKYEPPTPKELQYISKEIYNTSLYKYENNNFVTYLKSIIKDEKEVCKLIQTFQIGTAYGNKTAFPMIDLEGNIRTGQIILFDATTGKRNKNELINWLHNASKLKITNYETCLLGLHQLKNVENQNKPIAIVEAAKTAITMTHLKPQYVWLASCGLGGLSVAKCEPLKGKSIILYPDVAKATDSKRPYDHWTTIKEQLDQTKQYGNISVFIELENFVNRLDPNSEQYKRIRTIGYDLHDFATDNNWFEPKEIIHLVPGIKTTTERILQDMITQNPNIQTMIHRFELLNPVTKRPYICNNSY